MGSGSPVIAKAGFEFDGSVFGQIMKQALFIQAAAKTQFHDPKLMIVNGKQMTFDFFKLVHSFILVICRRARKQILILQFKPEIEIITCVPEKDSVQAKPYTESGKFEDLKIKPVPFWLHPEQRQ